VGIGVALAVWMGGLEPAAGACRVEPDGTLTVQVGSVDLTGTNTSMALIAAEVFGLPVEKVRVVNPDTDAAPYAGAAGGSKTLYTVGKAVMEAAQDARNQVLEMAGQRLEAAPDDLELKDGRVFVRGVPSKSVSIGELAGLATRFGSPYPPLEGRARNAIRSTAPGFSAHLARVRVDRETGHVKVTGYVAVQDVGRAINPPAVDGQIRGGTVQGLGRALFEAFPYDRTGQPLALTLADYALPGAGDVPNIDVVRVEVPSEDGPFGAKGVGEPPAIPGAAALVSAIEAAVGVRLTVLPVRPASLVRAIVEQASDPPSSRGPVRA
jgi:CO/xanthine dehydrogenase Mo-binding subunit